MLWKFGEKAQEKKNSEAVEGKVECYEGNWENDMRNGYGKLTEKNGIIYEGQWWNNKKHGTGSLIWQNAVKKFVGEFKEDFIDGEGVIYSYFDGNNY